jgi:hypothetical protein
MTRRPSVVFQDRHSGVAIDLVSGLALVQQIGNNPAPGGRATALNGASCHRSTNRSLPFNAVRGAVQITSR